MEREFRRLEEHYNQFIVTLPQLIADKNSKKMDEIKMEMINILGDMLKNI